MSTTTTDPTDPRLGRGVDDEPRPQQETYLVLSDEEKAKGVRRTYRHTSRGSTTILHGFIVDASDRGGAQSDHFKAARS